MKWPIILGSKMAGRSEPALWFYLILQFEMQREGQTFLKDRSCVPQTFKIHLERMIGEGSFGQVFKARLYSPQHKDGLKVAVKRIAVRNDLAFSVLMLY